MAKTSDKEFTIGSLAEQADVNIQTIRFYERQGLLQPVLRRDSGYRVYDDGSLKRLHFIVHAKGLGFSLAEIKELLGLRIRSVEGCNRVRAKANHKLLAIQDKIYQLRKLERTLKALICDCDNRVISDRCPIIEKMEM